MQTAKHTAWKKSRTFGDIFGGRLSLKLADNIFNRLHNLLPPTPGQQKPVFIVDNSSRDFYFPISPDEIWDILNKLPLEQTVKLTHIWLRKFKKADYLGNKTIQGCFISGSGVNLIILYPFPTNLKMHFGVDKPLRKTLKFYKDYCTDIHKDKQGWYLQWTEDAIKHYYLETLLLHEIGHCIDSVCKRYWSKAATKRTEDFADNYAAIWANNIRQTT